MEFNIRFDETFESEDLYKLQDEMTKYKTLAHNEIRWDFVYSCSLEILQHNSLDSKILHYFIISLVTLKQKELFEILPTLLDAFLELHHNKTWKKPSLKNTQEKFLKNSILLLIESSNKSMIIPQHLIDSLQERIDRFKILLNIQCDKLKKINTTQTIITPTIHHTATNQSTSNNKNDINTMNDREYREHFLSLAKLLLAQNIANPNISGIFIQACYGRIMTLPQHKESITNIPYPQQNTIDMLDNLSKNPPNIEVFSTFMDNLTLNPYYLIGQKIFVEYLKTHNFIATAESLAYLINNFLHVHSEIFSLKFATGELFCDNDTRQFFVNFNKIADCAEMNLMESRLDSNPETLEDALKSIESLHKNYNLKSKLHILIDIADTFHNNNLNSSAKTIYQQILNIIQTSELKEYLMDEYIRIERMASE